MKSKITKLAAAATIVIAAVIGITFIEQSVPTAYAQVLQDAIDAVSDIWSVHMNARMRTLPSDNFSLIGLDYDFVPIEMWKQTDENGLVRWRVEKPGRVLLMDGQSTTMLIRPNHGVIKEETWPLGCFDSWMGRLLNVSELLDSEMQNAKDNPDRQIHIQHTDIEGRDKIVLEVDVTTDVAENDYLRNQFISDSDHLKVYRFDTETNLLESFQVFVYTKDNDVLVFEVTDIEYNTEIPGSVFALDLPEDMIWHTEPQILPDNEKYENMTPKEVAAALFQACAEENWDEVLKFWGASSIDEQIKEYLGGLEIISIGEPFKSGGYRGWFIPYEIRIPSQKFNLRLSKTNAAGRLVITGMCDSKLRLLREMKWSNEPEVLPDNDTYAKMSPDEAVKAFNEAFSRQDWDEMRKFAPDSFVEELKHDFEEWTKRGQPKEEQPFCEVIGKSVWSEENSAYFVRCRVPGGVKKHNLAIRNDNEAHRWQFDGGI